MVLFPAEWWRAASRFAFGMSDLLGRVFDVGTLKIVLSRLI